MGIDKSLQDKVTPKTAKQVSGQKLRKVHIHQAVTAFCNKAKKKTRDDNTKKEVIPEMSSNRFRLGTEIDRHPDCKPHHLDRLELHWR